MKKRDELATLRKSDLHPNPFIQFEIWFQEAWAAKIKLAHAMTLATADKEGIPSARMVLLKGVDERGFVFYSNHESQKGRELAENPNAALVLYWRELNRQVRITGSVSHVSDEESVAYFRSRPIGSRLGAWASRQSEVIPNHEVLVERVEALKAQYQGQEIPLPPYWGGFRVVPNIIEFWESRQSRLHDRFRYRREPNNAWLLERLSP